LQTSSFLCGVFGTRLGSLHTFSWAPPEEGRLVWEGSAHLKGERQHRIRGKKWLHLNSGMLHFCDCICVTQWHSHIVNKKCMNYPDPRMKDLEINASVMTALQLICQDRTF
jgi:hypothetical protein